MACIKMWTFDLEVFKKKLQMKTRNSHWTYSNIINFKLKKPPHFWGGKLLWKSVGHNTYNSDIVNYLI